MDNTSQLIILDRDGVINHDMPGYVKTPDEWQPIAGSMEAIARLYHANFRIVIASNQSAIGRGLMSPEALYEIHLKMQGLLSGLGARVEALFFCPHSPAARCDCRKPQPGLLQQISQRFKINLSGVPFIGDTLKDVVAALSVEAEPLLVLTGQGQDTADSPEFPTHIKTYANLSAAVNALLI